MRARSGLINIDIKTVCFNAFRKKACGDALIIILITTRNTLGQNGYGAYKRACCRGYTLKTRLTLSIRSYSRHHFVIAFSRAAPSFLCRPSWFALPLPWFPCGFYLVPRIPGRSPRLGFPRATLPVPLFLPCRSHAGPSHAGPPSRRFPPWRPPLRFQAFSRRTFPHCPCVLSNHRCPLAFPPRRFRGRVAMECYYRFCFVLFFFCFALPPLCFWVRAF